MPKVSKLLTDEIVSIAESGLKKTISVKNRLKLLAIVYAKNHGIKKAAEVYNISTSAITDWIHRLREESLEGLNNKPKKSRSPFTKNQREAIEKLLSNDNNMTIDALKLKAEKELGLKLAHTTAYRIMQRLGFSFYKKGQKSYSKFKKESGKDRWRQNKS